MTGVPLLSVKVRRQDSFRFESLAVLLLLCIATSLLSPYFLTGRNLLNILLATSVIGILALGMTFVICMAAIDLSVGSTLALSAVIAGTVVSVYEMPWPLGILAALGTGVLGAPFSMICLALEITGDFSARAGRKSARSRVG